MRDETMVEMGNFITVCNGFNGGGSLISEWRWYGREESV
jgi:hypothetical protein